MSGEIGEPKKMTRAKKWTEEVEEAWRLQQAGYRDAVDYFQARQKEPERWTDEDQRIKKLEVIPKNAKSIGSGDNCHYMYFDRAPELKKNEIHTVKLYTR